ncbi:Replicative DNA helicase [Prosthecobacter debontii]|uniref:DNA 5'-3' helicase n=1 Tax=Prosthecobacter debontii TaxID=48467 RepID=A0A1T4X4R5_9BACT|nr:DnaB-like helicase C-terminal domain-containing protein [Prosthecobacter debontii]SKA84643.1 Replicative DNA helicase [Prosthecobacter debontii]
MIAAQANPYGRKRHEAPGAEELLELIQQPLPSSEEAETGVISSWMWMPHLLEDGGVQPAAFHHESRRIIASELMSLHVMGNLPVHDGQFDAALFTHHLRNRGLLDKAGGPSAITELATSMPVPGHYIQYRKILTECFQRRQIIHRLLLSVEKLQTLGRTGEDLPAVVSEIHTGLSDIETDDDSADLPCRTIQSIITTVVEKAEHRANNPGVLPGVSTGITRLDELTGGLQRGRLWAVLAESSEGKSSLCRQIVEEACKQGHAGVIYTYEMMDDEEAGRMICSQGVVSSNTMKTGHFTRAELQGFQQACQDIQRWNIAIVDVAGRPIEDIHRDIQRRKRRLKAGQELIVMIDYIQLALTRKECNSRQREIAHITGSTKQIAKRAGCTILMPSQVNKDGEAREAMDIEQDADIEIKIIKPEKPKSSKKQPWKKGADDEEDDPIAKSKRLLKLAKNRDGPKGDCVPVRMVGPHFRFAEFQPEQQELL